MENKLSYMRLMMDFYHDMESDNISLIYEGEVTQDITKAFATLAEKNMEKFYEDVKVRRKVYHVMIECLQNISKHADDDSSVASDKLEDGLSKNGVFAVGTQGNHWVVTSGNVIQEDKEESIKALIDEVNSLDKEGLRALYKEKIKASKISEKGGAGLGFVDIAKKTGNKLEYHFKDVGNGRKFFLLKIKISSNKID